MTREEFHKALGAALGSEDAWAALRSVMLDALASGQQRRSVLVWLDEARELYPGCEEALLDAMDQLEDWPLPDGPR